MGMGIRATLVLASICSLCLCCRSRTVRNMETECSVPAVSNYDHVDIYYEKGSAPWNYIRCFLVDAPVFLEDKDNLGLLRTTDIPFIQSLEDEIKEGVVSDEQYPIDAFVVALLFGEDMTDTLSLTSFPHFGYELNAKRYENREVYFVVWSYLFQHDLSWRKSVVSSWDILGYKNETFYDRIMSLPFSNQTGKSDVK